MIISHKHRFIFIHIPKCAGTSITNALVPVLGKQDLILGVTPEGEKLHEENLKKGGLTKHSSASVIRQQIGPEIWNSYFKFSFVRNPWDLLVSRYHWSLKTQWDDEFGTIKKIREFEDFEEYLYTPFVEKQNCMDFISDENGKILVDYAGKIELINWDLKRIYKITGVPSKWPKRENLSKHNDYIKYYNSITRDLVVDWYSRDIQNFNYQFINNKRYIGTGNKEKKYPKKKWLIIHCSYCGDGGGWFGIILGKIAEYFDWKYQKGIGAKFLPDNDTDITLHLQNNFDFSHLPHHVGTHLIRDPRDIIISVYFYHLRCNELWCKMPKTELGNKSYQEILNSLDTEDGILFEISSPFATFRSIAKKMMNWNYNNQYILELKFEEIMQDYKMYFPRVFQHYGFTFKETRIAMEIVDQCKFKNVTEQFSGSKDEKDHFHKELVGIWKKYFTKKHKKIFKEKYPGLLEKLGYEQNDLW